MRKRRSIIVCCVMACLLSGCGKEAPQIIDLNATTEQSVSTAEVSTDIDPDPGHATRTETSTEPLTEQKTERVTEKPSEKVTEKIAEPVTERTTEMKEKPKVTGDDTFGSIAGIGFGRDKFDFDETFKKAGYVLGSGANYPGTELNGNIALNEDEDTLKLSVGRVETPYTIADILARGFDCYSVNVLEASESYRPYMTFKGLTWKASIDDIIKAYGNPTARYNIDESLIVLRYEYENYGIEFSCAPGVVGLYGVDVFKIIRQE